MEQTPDVTAITGHALKNPAPVEGMPPESSVDKVAMSWEDFPYRLVGTNGQPIHFTAMPSRGHSLSSPAMPSPQEVVPGARSHSLSEEGTSYTASSAEQEAHPHLNNDYNALWRFLDKQLPGSAEELKVLCRPLQEHCRYITVSSEGQTPCPTLGALVDKILALPVGQEAIADDNFARLMGRLRFNVCFSEIGGDLEGFNQLYIRYRNTVAYAKATEADRESSAALGRSIRMLQEMGHSPQCLVQDKPWQELKAQVADVKVTLHKVVRAIVRTAVEAIEEARRDGKISLTDQRQLLFRLNDACSIRHSVINWNELIEVHNYL